MEYAWISLEPGGTARVVAIGYPEGWLVRWIWATPGQIYTGYPGRPWQFAESVLIFS